MDDAHDSPRPAEHQRGTRKRLAFTTLVIQLSTLGQHAAARALLSPEERQTLIYLCEAAAAALKEEA